MRHAGSHCLTIREMRSDKESQEEAATFFRHVRAAAESGWDFCSRWFAPTPVDGLGIRRDLTTIRTTNVLPVHLNALPFGMEKRLHAWTGEEKYKTAAAERKTAILERFWNEELGWFFDFCTEVEDKLFDVKLQSGFVEQLDVNRLPEAVLKKFEEHQRPLGSQLTAELEVEGSSWIVFDSDQKYRIRMRKRATLPILPKLPMVR